MPCSVVLCCASLSLAETPCDLPNRGLQVATAASWFYPVPRSPPPPAPALLPCVSVNVHYSWFAKKCCFAPTDAGVIAKVGIGSTFPIMVQVRDFDAGSYGGVINT